MKKLAFITLIVLFACMLASCAKDSSKSVEQMINPGDKIGDFLITTGEEGNVTYGFDLDCVKQGNGKNYSYSCKSPVGKTINITTGIYDDTVSNVPTTATPKLNEKWSSYTYELSIEGRPVNLQGFGYIDIPHPLIGVVRFWNIVIIASKPGKITIHESGVVGGDPFGSTSTYTFSAP